MQSFFTKEKIEENMRSEDVKYKLLSLAKEFPSIDATCDEFINLIRMKKSKKKHVSIAEIGIGVGASAVEVYKLLDKGDKYYCFDFDYVISALVHDLELLDIPHGRCDVIAMGNTESTYDSYNWSLGKLIIDMREKEQEGIFDIIYLDGAHTFFHDGLACCMLKEMCNLGGYIILDDVNWSHVKSPTQKKNLDELSGYYTWEQLEDCQVRRVENVFLRNDHAFRKVSKNNSRRAIYKRIANVNVNFADEEFEEQPWENIPISLAGDFANPRARIDIKNQGEGNDVKVKFAEKGRHNFYQAGWFSKGGAGYVLETGQRHLLMELECVGAGQLLIRLQGIDRRIRGIRIPLWVDYTFMSVNGETIFRENKALWHDRAYPYTRKVADGERLKVEISWNEHGYRGEELARLISLMPVRS